MEEKSRVEQWPDPAFPGSYLRRWKLFTRVPVATTAHAGSDAGEAGAEQEERRRLRDGRLLRACDGTGERDGLAGVNRNVDDVEEKRAGAAGGLLSRDATRRVGLAVHVVEGEQERRVVEVNEDTALVVAPHSARDVGRKRSLVRAADALRGGERHLEGEGLPVVDIGRGAQRERAEIVEVRSRVPVATEAAEAAGSCAGEGSVAVGHPEKGG